MARDKKPLKICPLHKCLLQEEDKYCPWHGVPLDPLIGQTINGFIIEEPLSGGGYAVVYRAIAVANREFVVAMKILRPPYCYQQARVEDFLNEAVATQGIPPPNVPPIFGVMGTPWPHLTMELVRGSTLEAYLLARSEGARQTTDPSPRPAAPRSLPRLVRAKRPPVIPLGESIDYLIGIARPIAEAHRLGRVHRDLKPANIMISEDGKARPDDRVKVIDWGIALVLANTQSEAVDPDSTLVERKTARYQIAGTLPYMAPEAFDGRYSPQTDVYAFGVTAFELLSGERPHDPPPSTSPTLDTVSAWKNVHQNSEPKRLSDYRRVPKRLRRVVRNCLQKAPEARPTDGKTLLQELLEIRKARDWRVFVRRTLGMAASILILLLTVFLIRDIFFAKLSPESLRSLAEAMNLGHDQGSSFYASSLKEVQMPLGPLPGEFNPLTFTISSDDGTPPDNSPRSITELPRYLSEDWYKGCQERQAASPGARGALTCRVLLKGRARDILPKRVSHELSFIYDLDPPAFTNIAINSRSLALAGDTPQYFQLSPSAIDPTALCFELSFQAEDNVPLPDVAFVDATGRPVAATLFQDALQDPGRTIRRRLKTLITLPQDVASPLRLRVRNLAGMYPDCPPLHPVPRPEQIEIAEEPREPRITPDALELTWSLPRQITSIDGWNLKYVYTEDKQEPAPPSEALKLKLTRPGVWLARADPPDSRHTCMWVYLDLTASSLDSAFISRQPVQLPPEYTPQVSGDFAFTLDTIDGDRVFIRDSRNPQEFYARTNAKPKALVISLKNAVEERLKSLELGTAGGGAKKLSLRQPIYEAIAADSNKDSTSYSLTYVTLRGSPATVQLTVQLDPAQPAPSFFTMNGVRIDRAARVFVPPAPTYTLVGPWPEHATKLLVTVPESQKLRAGLSLSRNGKAATWDVKIDAADIEAALSSRPCDIPCAPCGYLHFFLNFTDAFKNTKETRLTCGIFGQVDTIVADDRGKRITEEDILLMSEASMDFTVCNAMGFDGQPTVRVTPESDSREVTALPPTEVKYGFRYQDRDELRKQVVLTIGGVLANGEKVMRSIVVRPRPPDTVPDFLGLSWSRVELLDDQSRKECVYVSTSEVSWKALRMLVDEGSANLEPAIREKIHGLCDVHEQSGPDLPATGVLPEVALLLARSAGCDLLTREEVRRILREQATEKRAGGMQFCKKVIDRENVNSRAMAPRVVMAQKSDRTYFYGLVDFVGNTPELVKPDGDTMVYGVEHSACVCCDCPVDKRCAFVVSTNPLSLDGFAPRTWKGVDSVSFRLVIRAGSGACKEFEELVNCVPQ